jgi:hypothetical protein
MHLARLKPYFNIGSINLIFLSLQISVRKQEHKCWLKFCVAMFFSNQVISFDIITPILRSSSKVCHLFNNIYSLCPIILDIFDKNKNI